MSAPAPPAEPAGAPEPPAPSLVPWGGLWLTYFATMGAFNPYAPLWFKSLGLGTLAIGAIASLQSWTRLIAPYAWSWLADHRGGRVRLLRFAAGGALLAALGLALAPWLGALVGGGTGAASVASAAASAPMAAAGAPGVPVAWLVAMVALLFIANGGVVPLAEAALAQLIGTAQGVDPGRYGRVRVWGSVGFILAVMAAGPWLQWAGIGAFAWTVVALNALLLAATWRVPPLPEVHHHHEPTPPVWPVLRQPAVAWLMASMFFTVLAHTSLYAFFSLYLDELGYPKSAVGALWAVSVGAEIIAFLTQGRWFRWCSPHGWLQWAGVVAALRFAATAVGGAQAAVLVLCQLTHVVTFAAHHAACITLVSRYFPGRLRGRGQALYSALGYGLSGLVGGVGGGWLIEHLGFAAVFWAATVAGAVGWACAWRAGRLADAAG